MDSLLDNMKTFGWLKTLKFYRISIQRNWIVELTWCLLNVVTIIIYIFYKITGVE